MIEIKKVRDIELAQKICGDNGVDWNPQYHIIATIENDTVLQCAVFDYENEDGEILVIDGFDGEISLLDGLCRAILNIMDINGVKLVTMPLKYKKIADHVGFKLQKENYQLELEGFFQCGCCK
ncbi:MAG: hypothetical protein IJ043_07210 [Clostridia bacterium]|nr:hypothetical protein [Clostridia bacterium]